MTEQWAKDCVKLEKAANTSIFKATLVYETKWNEDWTTAGIAEEVQKAGGSIAEVTVRRRLDALAVARRNPRPSLEAAFSKAYAEENRATRGGFGTPVPAEERRRVYLEGVVGEFDRLFQDPSGLDDEERSMIEQLRDRCDAALAGRTWVDYIGPVAV